MKSHAVLRMSSSSRCLILPPIQSSADAIFLLRVFWAAKRPFIPPPTAGGAVFGLDGWPGGRSLWGKPGLGGFEPARGEAPIEAALWVRMLISLLRSRARVTGGLYVGKGRNCLWNL